MVLCHHNMRNCIKTLQHLEGWKPTLSFLQQIIDLCSCIDLQFAILHFCIIQAQYSKTHSMWWSLKEDVSVTPSKTETSYMAICTYGVPGTRSHPGVFQKVREALHMNNCPIRCFQSCPILLVSLYYTWRRDLIIYILLFGFWERACRVIFSHWTRDKMSWHSVVLHLQVSRHFRFLFQPSEFFACVFY